MPAAGTAGDGAAGVPPGPAHIGGGWPQPGGQQQGEPRAGSFQGGAAHPQAARGWGSQPQEPSQVAGNQHPGCCRRVQGGCVCGRLHPKRHVAESSAMSQDLVVCMALSLLDQRGLSGQRSSVHAGAATCPGGLSGQMPKQWVWGPA